MASEASNLSALKLASELSQTQSVAEALERIRILLWGKSPPDVIALHAPQRTISLTQTAYQALPVEFQQNKQPSLQNEKLLSPLVLSDVALTNNPIASKLQVRGLRSVALIPVNQKYPCVFEVSFYNRYHRFREEEKNLIESAAVVLAGALSAQIQEERGPQMAESGTNARVLALSFDKDFNLTQIIGPVERLLGTTAKALLQEDQW